MGSMDGYEWGISCNGRFEVKTHYIPSEVDSAILSLCESLDALLEHADMGEIHDEETRETVEQAKCALAFAHSLRICVAH